MRKEVLPWINDLFFSFYFTIIVFKKVSFIQANKVKQPKQKRKNKQTKKKKKENPNSGESKLRQKQNPQNKSQMRRGK